MLAGDIQAVLVQYFCPSNEADMARKTKKAANPTVRKAYIYIRCSHEDQQDGGHTLQVQEDKARKACADAGYVVAGVYIDPTISGGTNLRDRPAGARLWAEIEAGSILVASKQDRCFRDTNDATGTFKDCVKRDIGLAFVDRGMIDVTTDHIQKFIFENMASAASLERAMIGARIRDVKSYQRERGMFLGGNFVPFGYLVEDRNGQKYLVPNEPLQARVIDLRRREFSVRQITVELAVYDAVKVSQPTIAKFLREHMPEGA